MNKLEHDDVLGLLQRMSVVLNDVEQELGAVSEIMSEILSSQHVQLSNDQITKMQKIDRICQTVKDLSLLSANFSTGSSEDKHSRGPRLQLNETRKILDPDLENKNDVLPGTLELF